MYIEQREIIIRIGIISLQGRLDEEGADQLTKALEQQSERGINSLLVDLHRVNFIDSAGVAALVGGMKQLRAKGGDLRLIGLQPGPRSIFELMALDKVFTIFETEAEALLGL
ncbi:STAS domain-containing protein [Candidatus Chlorohelix sp.]|uniref:STAS domain-containing protein n=1 Tax=Candidatus Chlorohelix sp. TaxID=3139201 RepID=UPI003063D47B